LIDESGWQSGYKKSIPGGLLSVMTSPGIISTARSVLRAASFSEPLHNPFRNPLARSSAR
jgi:hypothetical protein